MALFLQRHQQSARVFQVLPPVELIELGLGIVSCSAEYLPDVLVPSGTRTPWANSSDRSVYRESFLEKE